MKTLNSCKVAPAGFRRDLIRWRQLVRPEWLAALIAQTPVEAPPSTDWRLFEVGYNGVEVFLSGHIPGASYIDTLELEEAPLWNKVSDQALLQLLLNHGIQHDTTVVLYDRNSLTAARAAHLLLYAGVKDVRLLDGGFCAWVAAVSTLEQGLPVRREAASSFGIGFPACPHYMINIEQAKTLRLQPDGVLVSIRTWDEFMGKTSGYSYIEARGDIQGARWGHAGPGDNVNSMSDFHRADGTMKAPDEICRFWKGSDIHSDQQIAFYCGTGWRASLAFFYAWLMHWERISVYDGGWYEWSRDRRNPVIHRSDALLAQQ